MAESCGSSCGSNEAQQAAAAQQENAITRSLGKIKNKILVFQSNFEIPKKAANRSHLL